MSADDRRDRLVEAAIRVMTRDGVAQATTRAIVAEADMALGAFHYCFRSKRELLETVVETITAHSLARVTSMTEQRSSVRATVRASLHGYWDHVVAHPEEHQLTYELTQYALRAPGLEEVARTQYEFYLRTLGAFVEDVAATHAVAFSLPTPVLARYLFTIIDGLTLNWLVIRDDGVPSVLDEVADHVASLARPAG